MKQILQILLLAAAMSRPVAGNTQNINWRALRLEQAHVIQARAGMDYGTIAGIGYGCRVWKKLPLLLNIDHAFVAGENRLDDFKTRIGAAVEIYRKDWFSATVKAYGVFRRNETDAARFLNFGSEFSTMLGYMKKRWYAGVELGFDKAITTQVKHSRWSRENYPAIMDGWYLPTGGNFSYGVQLSYSFRNSDISVKGGKRIAQDLKASPLLPVYLELGYNRRF